MISLSTWLPHAIGSPAPDERPLLRRLAAPLGAAAGFGAFMAVLAWRDPSTAGHYPTCPFLWLTGWYCPGCGTLRALHSLGQGDVGAALGFNPLTVVTLVVLAVAWAMSLNRAWRGYRRNWMAPPSWLWTIFAVTVAFWFARNLPGATWLSPR